MSARALAAVVALLLAAGVSGYGWYASTEGLAPFEPPKDKWTAVFLSNGQTYFGNLYLGPGDFAQLRDVYYLLQTQVQSQDPQRPAQPQISLQRLGGEIHGPTSDMRISKQQILFYEELRPDSALVAAIVQLKLAPPAPPVPQAAPTPAPARSPASPSAPAATPTPVRTASPSASAPASPSR